MLSVIATFVRPLTRKLAISGLDEVLGLGRSPLGAAFSMFRRTCGLNRGEHPLRKQWEFLDSDFERVINRIPDSRSDANDRQFSDAFCAKRTLGKRNLHGNRHDFRNLVGGGNFIIHERRIDHLAFVKLQPLMQGVSETHDNPAIDLTADADRIQGRPDIVGGSDFSYFDHSGLIIDLDLYRLSAVFPARYVFFSMDFVRQRRIVAFTAIPPPAQDRFFSIVSLLQNFSK